MPRRLADSPPTMPLYPSEQQIARAVLGERAGEWQAKAIVLERDGLPRIDPFMGGRFWPSVQRFFAVYAGLDHADQPDSNPAARVLVVPFAPDGPENPHGAPAQAHDHRWRTGGPRRRAGA